MLTWQQGIRATSLSILKICNYGLLTLQWEPLEQIPLNISISCTPYPHRFSSPLNSYKCLISCMLSDWSSSINTGKWPMGKRASDPQQLFITTLSESFVPINYLPELHGCTWGCGTSLKRLKRATYLCVTHVISALGLAFVECVSVVVLWNFRVSPTNF